MKVLLLCASHNDLGLIMGLRKLGYEIIVTGKISGQPGEKYCDKYIQADYSDKKLILEIAKSEEIDRICACCNDYGVYTAAYVAEKLGIPGYDSYKNTCLINNKDLFLDIAKKLGILVPWSVGFNDRDSALVFLEKCDLPVIVKPVDASAGNGITIIESVEEIYEAVEYAYSKSREGRIVVNQFISGTQHGLCTFLVNQKIRAECSNNEYSFQNRYRVEVDTFPSDACYEAKKFLLEEIERIAQYLNLNDGIFHLQYIMHDGKPYIIEAMRRAIGNMYSVLADQLNGIQWDYWEARALTGMSCVDFPSPVKQEGFFAYKTILSNENGVIKEINIPDEYEKYIFKVFMLKKIGDVIENHYSQPIGFLFFIFRTQEEMKKVLINNYRSDLVEMNCYE